MRLSKFCAYARPKATHLKQRNVHVHSCTFYFYIIQIMRGLVKITEFSWISGLYLCSCICAHILCSASFFWSRKRQTAHLMRRMFKSNAFSAQRYGFCIKCLEQHRNRLADFRSSVDGITFAGVRLDLYRELWPHGLGGKYSVFVSWIIICVIDMTVNVHKIQFIILHTSTSKYVTLLGTSRKPNTDSATFSRLQTKAES